MNIKIYTLLFITTVCIAFIANGQQQIENPGFETWEEIGFGPDTLEPVQWNSLKSSDGGFLINKVIPVTMEQSTDAHSGMYSVKLVNDTILGMVAPGTMTNGRVHATLPPSAAYVYTIDSMPDFNTSFTDLPDSLDVWAKFFPITGDIGHIIAVLHTDTAKIADPDQTNWVAVATIDFTEETTDWTKFSAPFVYLNSDTPEYILFAIYAGDAQNALLGSALYLDDFELIYHNTSIDDKLDPNIDLYFSGNNLIIKGNNDSDENSTIEILDLSGRVLFSKQINDIISVRIPVDLPKGIYICRIQNTSFNVSQKLIKD